MPGHSTAQRGRRNVRPSTDRLRLRKSKSLRELRSAGYDDFVISEVDGGPEVFAETCRRMEKILRL